MTVSTVTNRISYAGNGSTTVFSYPYYFLATADLVVLIVNDTTDVETVQTITTHYSVGTPSTSGANVTMVTAPATGETLVIYRDPTLTQSADYEDNDAFPAATHEEALDRSVMLHIRTRELIGQGLKLPENDTDTAVLPVSTDRADGVLGFDSDGDPTIISQVSMRRVEVTANYTMVAADFTNTALYSKSASNLVVTIPTNATVASGLGAAFLGFRLGTGTLTFTGDTGVTVNGASAGSAVVGAQYTGIVGICLDTVDEWLIDGNAT